MFPVLLYTVLLLYCISLYEKNADCSMSSAQLSYVSVVLLELGILLSSTTNYAVKKVGH